MRKLNLSIVVGVIVAVLGAAIVVAYGQSVDKRIASGKHPVAVLVADSDLAAGTPAAELTSKVHVAQVPQAFAVSNPLGSISALTSDVPKGAVLTGPVPTGGQLSSSSFADAATAGHVRPAPGHVAISVETDLSPGVARYLSVGSVVDVFATYHEIQDKDGKMSRASSRTKLFATDIKVLAVSVAQAEGDEADGHDAPGLSDKVVVLLDMSARDAEKLVNAATLGQIYLADANDGHHTTPRGTKPADVVKSNR